MDKSPDQKKAADSRHFVIFLPFLRMRTGRTVAGVEFLPLRDDDDNVPAALETAVAPLERILSGYVDRHPQISHRDPRSPPAWRSTPGSTPAESRVPSHCRPGPGPPPPAYVDDQAAAVRRGQRSGPRSRLHGAADSRPMAYTQSVGASVWNYQIS